MQRSELKFAPALCTMLMFRVHIHPFVSDPGKFPFLYHSLGDERVFSPPCHQTGAMGCVRISEHSGDLLANVDRGTVVIPSFPPAWARPPAPLPGASACAATRLWAEPVWPHAAPLPAALSWVAKWDNASAGVTALTLTPSDSPRCESVHLLRCAQARYVPMTLVGFGVGGLVGTSSTAVLVVPTMCSSGAPIRLINHL